MMNSTSWTRPSIWVDRYFQHQATKLPHILVSGFLVRLRKSVAKDFPSRLDHFRRHQYLVRLITTLVGRIIHLLSQVYNCQGYPDLVPDGHIGPATLAALDEFLKVRGKASAETVLMRALEALQGERYLRLAERRPANEAFLYGWLVNRVGER